ncbi:hypothetical protein GQ43DRAFT_425754 [Delitschia confertaspora ATCC 74209]|uniref:CENP-V/GFA domain-containing protein n=1 Tax=Delitschia confertaspora ATCC 74209 TaxID=1513339 RepID=A0A9P4JCX4_9PLEO|nr:hypothetical protein GQ43DRAFT_425754 [Delitschia confertaspora ATCC 74209]
MASKAFHGSCHCGSIQYLVRVTLPPDTTNASPFTPGTHIYKCNCTTCHKAGFFHLRPNSASEDFLLLSPNPSELGDYSCLTKQMHWYFCKTCGVKPFCGAGGWVKEEVDVNAWKGEEKRDGEGKKKTAWKLTTKEVEIEKADRKIKKEVLSLNVNATTLDARQEGLDLREWHEKKWVFYLDVLDFDVSSYKEGMPMPAMGFEGPYPGGMY